jgi:excisionase family DNA binding protein
MSLLYLTLKRVDMSSAEREKIVQQVVAEQSQGLATVSQACKFLSVSRGTLYALMNRGELLSRKIGGLRRVPWAALHRLAESGNAA